jgi:hypothetical protein
VRDRCSAKASAERDADCTRRRSRRGLTAPGRRRLHVFCSKSLEVSIRKPLHLFVCNNACASSLTNPFNASLLETLVFFFPGNTCSSRPATLRQHLLSKTRHRSPTNPSSHSRTNETGLPASGARSVEQCRRRSRFVKRAIAAGRKINNPRRAPANVRGNEIDDTLWRRRFRVNPSVLGRPSPLMVCRTRSSA